MSDTLNVFQAGNTIRLQCIFEDFDGNKINPENVKITFYDRKYFKLEETILSIGNSISLGVFVYNHRTSNEEEERFIYEWYGEINGLPSLKRSTFRTVFI